MAGSLGVLSYIIACTTAVTLAYAPTSFLPTDRPVHLALLTLLCLIAALLLVVKRFPSIGTSPSHRAQYAAIPLHELQDNDDKNTKEIHHADVHALSGKSLLLVILVAGLALACRIEVQRKLLLASECATRSVEVWLPLLVAVYDALRFEKRQAVEQDDADDLSSSVYHDLTQSTRSLLLSSPWRYVPAAFLLSLGCHAVAGLWLSSESSHVCPLVSSDIILVPRLQWLALLLDTVLVISAFELSLVASPPSATLLATPKSWTIVLILAFSGWIIVTAVLLNTQPENRAWFLLTDESNRLASLLLMTFHAVFLAIFCLNCLYSVIHVGLLHTSMALTACLTMVPGVRFIWSVRKPYPPISSLNLTWSFVAIYLGWSMFSRIYRATCSAGAEPSMLRRICTFLLLCVLLYPGLMKSHTVYFHPVDLLMYDAQNKYLNYLNYASQSTTLSEAVHNYQQSYQDNPPPGFDVWYKFAKSRSVYIIDEYNQIYNDLLPFRAISPSELRRQTWEMVSNPWNEVSGITIRDGKAKVQENVLPTHRWMLEGVVKIIDSFSQHLPDMDLAFNLNDESRVSVPFEGLQSLQDAALGLQFRGTSGFSSGRAVGWNEIPAEPSTDTVFENWSFRNTYYEWGALTCPPTSPARRGSRPLFKSQLCLNCAADHSLGQFVSNWSVAADPCHQPDLANLHGFYLSPAAFKATHLLRPVFSQSKVRGFNDILYPSAWNYMDKIAYSPTNVSSGGQPAFPDVPYREKNSTMYWRGATSEGVSTGIGSWRGMARQRMVHMANNLTMSQHDKVTILLPDKKRANRYTYVTVPGESLGQIGLQPDISFVDHIARCGGRDCAEQEQELGLAPPQDFQSHWQHKYLVDLDGAGFSGRFLPFLESHSLPLKAALFREWYDSRLVPWLHFVPLDLRLHGLWSTLAYFTGVKGRDFHGTHWDWEGHEREGELIADAGREWARKVLRKQDMEVYFFRLLLEWARLTDDRRDELGFTIT